MEIIGQRKLLNNIDNLIENNTFPRFSIIQGVEGSGKRLISAYIAKKLNATYVPCELGIDAVRDVINLSYEQVSPIVYVWADAHKMSINAKNAILKVTEEPPQTAYFIMTTDNINNILDTLISRGTVFNISPYSKAELSSYVESRLPNIDSDTKSTIVDISITPKNIIDMSRVDIAKMQKTVNVLCDSVGKVNLANILKIPTFLAFKDDDKDKFDPILFMRACLFRYAQLFRETENRKYNKLVSLTSTYLCDMYSKSLNKLSTIDCWLIDSHSVMAVK